VRLAGRTIVVRARGTGGRRLRSRSLHLSQTATEEGAEAALGPDGWLTITLRTERPAARSRGPDLEPTATRRKL